MTKKLFIKIGTICLLSTFLFIGFSNQTVLADDDNLKVEGLNILPDIDEKDINDINDKINTVGSEGGHVRDKYREIASDPEFTTEKQLTSGIMTWDTIMNYLVFVIKFLSQAGLTVGALFIMYAGYQYMTSVLSNSKPDNKMIRNAIIGILIVIFSYAIMKALTSIAGLS